jgi:transcriptional regulator with XRE-family HTH domain
MLGRAMDIPYLVRRARLVLGQTQSQFAEQFEVDDGTVSRWERGRLRPSPAIVAQLREIVLRLGFVAGKELIRASPILKCVSPIDDLTHPCVISKGARAALKRAGIPDHDLSTHIKEVQLGTSAGLSGAHALDVIQDDPAWVNRRAVYAEAHCFAILLGAWVDVMVIPLPDEPLALIEFVLSSPQGGFRVRVVRFEDLPARG